MKHWIAYVIRELKAPEEEVAITKTEIGPYLQNKSTKHVTAKMSHCEHVLKILSQTFCPNIFYKIYQIYFPQAFLRFYVNGAN